MTLRTMAAYPQWRPRDCADSISQSSCGIKEGVSNTITSPTSPHPTHHSPLALHRALDYSAAPMPPDLQAPPPRGRSHLPRRTDKPLNNLLSTSYQPLSTLPTAGYRSIFASKPMSGGRASTGASGRRVCAPAASGNPRMALPYYGPQTGAIRRGGRWCSLHCGSPVRVLSCYSSAAMLQAKKHARYRSLRRRASSESLTTTSPRKAIDLFGRREWLYVLSIAGVLTL